MRVSSPVIDLGNIKIYHFQEKRATLLRASNHSVIQVVGT